MRLPLCTLRDAAAATAHVGQRRWRDHRKEHEVDVGDVLDVNAVDAVAGDCAV